MSDENIVWIETKSVCSCEAHMKIILVKWFHKYLNERRPNELFHMLEHYNDLSCRELTKKHNESYNKTLNTRFKDSSHSAIGKKIIDLKNNFSITEDEFKQYIKLQGYELFEIAALADNNGRCNI